MDYRNIWVFIEKRKDQIHPVSFELLSRGRILASRLSERLIAVIFGDATKEERTELGLYGAEGILSIEAAEGAVNGYEAMAELFILAIKEEKPAILLAGATLLGRTLMPLVAVKLRTGLTADCTELEIDLERRILLQTRPAFGGNILATIECPHSRPQMATVRPHVFRMHKEKNIKDVQVIKKRYSLSLKGVLQVVESIIEEERLDITEASVIVSGGRGLGRAEGFNLLERLALKLGGMVGASRGAVDLGWISSVHQVGQTGHTVTPNLYIACGISGAIQHLAGMKSAETIISINEDPSAPIFEFSNYGIVGDLYEVIPKILEGMKKVENI